ncbi:MAG: amidase [SAR202 cluster bacterium]|nr:amidase [SAR202 cluster bacterium]
MSKTELPFLTATELSRQIKSKKVSPVEAVKAYLERIEKFNDKLNAYITVCEDDALKAAREAEREIMRGDYRGAMHGIPVACKDQWWTKGVRTTAGSVILKDFVPKEDATVQVRLKEAGGIMIGKTNLTEFAMGYNVRYPYGVPTNPWNVKHMPGGSSAGSGSALAAYLCSTALGEDTGGSIRGPATYCGIVGLRPSQGRVSRYGALGMCWSMDTVGPMSRTVEDCAMTLQVIAGHDPKDPYTWDQPAPDYVALLKGGIKGLRVGILEEQTHTDNVQDEVRAAVLKAASVLGELGADVREVSLPLSRYDRSISTPIMYTQASHVHYKNTRERLHDYDRNMQINLKMGNLIPAQTYYKAERLRQLLRAQYLELMETVDVLVYPTAATPAPLVLTKHGLGNKEAFKKEMTYGSRTLTSLGNTVGAPALSVPCGFSQDKLPIGLQLLGRPFEEATVLRAGHAYQQATDWHNRRPPVS